MTSSVQNTNKLLKIGIILSLFFSTSLIFGGWFYLKSYSDKIIETKSKVAGLQSDSRKITEIIQKYNRVDMYQPVVMESIPNSKEISSFIADISSVGVSNGMTINSSDILSKSKVSDQSLSQTIAKGDYSEIQIKYSMEGSYQNLLKTLNAIYDLRRVSSISDVNIIKNQTDTSGDGINASFTLSTFLKK